MPASTARSWRARFAARAGVLREQLARLLPLADPAGRVLVPAGSPGGAALTQPGRAGDAISKSRLYGWLMPAYKDPNSSLLRQHLPHRDGSELAEAAERLGWASWEDCRSVAPGACSWLTATPGTG